MRLPIISLLFLALISASVFLVVPITPVEAGVIPCGLTTADPDITGGGTEKCTLCHLIIGIQRIIVVLRDIMSAIAVAVVVAMAFIYITSAGDEGRMTFAKNGMVAALIGFIIILLAWLTVNFILTLPGLYNTGLVRTGWNTFQCNTASQAQ